MPEELRLNFEMVYYRHLLEIGTDGAMVQCGIDALLAGWNGPCVCSLAGADDERRDARMQIFRRAGAEIGVALPTSAEERHWVLQVTERLEREGSSLRVRSCREILNDDIFVLRRQLSAAMDLSKSTSLGDFVELLGVYHPDDYEVWLESLISAGARVLQQGVSRSIEVKVKGLVELNCALSYGGTTEYHLAWIRRLREGK